MLRMLDKRDTRGGHCLDGSASSSQHDDEYDRYRDIPDSLVIELIDKPGAGGLAGIDLTRIL